MTAEDRARSALEAWGNAVYAATQSGAEHPSSVGFIADAIREAENDALERAALSVDAAFPGDYGGKRIRAMKHRN